VVVRNTNEGWGTDGVKVTAVYEVNAEVWRSVEGGGPAVTKDQQTRWERYHRVLITAHPASRSHPSTFIGFHSFIECDMGMELWGEQPIEWVPLHGSVCKKTGWDVASTGSRGEQDDAAFPPASDV